MDARLYETAHGSTQRPVILYVHGGGFTAGAPELFDQACDHLARETGAVVISPRYRLAPDYPHPAAVNDCATVLDGIVAMESDLACDSTRIAMAGVSAGGAIAVSLAYATALPVRLVLMQSPLLDDRPHATGLDDGRDPIWSAKAARGAWKAYLGPGGTRSAAVPAELEDLRRLPPVYMSVGSREVTVPETLAFSGRLAELGVPVEFHMWDGMPHGFEIKQSDNVVARASTQAAVEALRRALD
ncbi:alpha/beta hydrolase [Aeromicrobium panaciterrae]|uniref:alpha/beta hydrolase n=1 Tax=Aeromicrobium panaciterrae TaxID=363861 RepID=UPI0031DCD63E